MSHAPRLTDLKREAIVHAAIAEFRQGGFETTSMDRIAETAGVSKRTVYNHFPSKDELFAEILRQLWLLTMLEHKLQVMSDDNFLHLARIVVAATIHSPERAQGMVARIAEKEQEMVRWIEAAQAHGTLKPADASIAAQQFHGLVKTFAFWPQITLGMPVLTPHQQRELAVSAVDMFLARYGT
jgi:TetR/AcrR family transcriptional regulator of autoinduction and epiphytic fitness